MPAVSSVAAPGMSSRWCAHEVRDRRISCVVDCECGAAMRALSLWRPWPWAIVHGEKRIENRPWDIKFRGDVAFQAAKRFDHAAVPFIQRLSPSAKFCSGEPSAHPAGVLVFVARIRDCMPIEQFHQLIGANSLPWMIEQRRWAFGPYCAVLDDIRPLAPVECKGHQGWFDVPDAIVAEALRAA
jgi:hypothetical protein